MTYVLYHRIGSAAHRLVAVTASTVFPLAYVEHNLREQRLRSVIINSHTAMTLVWRSLAAVALGADTRILRSDAVDDVEEVDDSAITDEIVDSEQIMIQSEIQKEKEKQVEEKQMEQIVKCEPISETSLCITPPPAPPTATATAQTQQIPMPPPLPPTPQRLLSKVSPPPHSCRHIVTCNIVATGKHLRHYADSKQVAKRPRTAPAAVAAWPAGMGSTSSASSSSSFADGIDTNALEFD
jgi:type IV secretory pathway VirB10-like protein